MDENQRCRNRSMICTCASWREGGPPLPEPWLPWYCFAAACILYDPPRPPELERFAEYAGLALPKQFYTSHDLLQEEMHHAVGRAIEEYICKKMWELREELGGLEFEAAHYDVLCRFGHEAIEVEERVRAQYEDMIELNDEPPTYYVEVDPQATVDRRREAIEAVAERMNLDPEHGVDAPKRGRRERESESLRVLAVAILRDDLEWSRERIADHYGWVDHYGRPSVAKVTKWATVGRRLRGEQ